MPAHGIYYKRFLRLGGDLQKVRDLLKFMYR